MSDLADEIMDGALERFNLGAITTVADADEADRWLTERIAALQAERDDEKTYPLEERDHDWLGTSKAVLKQANGLLFEVRKRRAEIIRAARMAESREKELKDFAGLKEVLRDRLDSESYRALWEEVYRRYPLLRLREATADGASA